MPQRKLLMNVRIEDCGDLFQVWTETYSDGTYEIHGHAECADCVKMLISIAAEVYPGVNVRLED